MITLDDGAKLPPADPAGVVDAELEMLLDAILKTNTDPLINGPLKEAPTELVIKGLESSRTIKPDM